MANDWNVCDMHRLATLLAESNDGPRCPCLRGDEPSFAARRGQDAAVFPAYMRG